MTDETTGTQPDKEPAVTPEQPPVAPSPPIVPPVDAAPTPPAPASIYPTPVTQVEPAAQPVPAAVPTAAPNPMPSVTTPESHNKAASLVIQWMAYAFWGWLVLSLSVLVSLILFSVFGESNSNAGVPYAIASTIVLLPIAYICDRLYSKKENAKKVGGEMAIMVIHAVIFALFAIGSLITAAFIIVSMLTGSGDGSGASTAKTVTLLCAIIIFCFYAATFIRTLAPPSFRWIPSVFRKVMLITVGITIIAGIVGPTAAEARTKNDRLITSNIDDVARSVSDYAKEHSDLPDSLSDLTLDGGAKTLVESNLVEYKPGKLHAKGINSTRITSSYYGRYDTYEYQLCVNYVSEKKGSYGYSSNYASSNYTSSYPSAYYHPKGEVCYKLITSEY